MYLLSVKCDGALAYDSSNTLAQFLTHANRNLDLADDNSRKTVGN